MTEETGNYLNSQKQGEHQPLEKEAATNAHPGSDQRSADLLKASETIAALRSQIERALIGQRKVLDQVLVTLLAGGHVLIEGVPGLGKTQLVKHLAEAVQCDFSRIQFTPDLMPADVTGHSMFNAKEQAFEIRKGPVFTNFLLADEINRAPAKTQAALLEVMQEAQVTIEGESMAAGTPFVVLATQNPIEQDGTYPLPEAELDRFMMKIFIDYPSEDHEQEMVSLILAESPPAAVKKQKLASAADVVEMQRLTRGIHVDAEVLAYAVKLVRTTRNWHGLHRGAGPRGSLSLIACAKAFALMEGSSFVTPDHVKEVALPVLRHRVMLSADMEIEGVPVDKILADILAEVPAPRK